MAEISAAPTQHATGDSTGFRMSGATYPPATGPKQRRINTFANLETASLPPKDFQGTIIACDMFDYSTKEDPAVVWTSSSKSSNGEFDVVYD